MLIMLTFVIYKMYQYIMMKYNMLCVSQLHFSKWGSKAALLSLIFKPFCLVGCDFLGMD